MNTDKEEQGQLVAELAEAAAQAADALRRLTSVLRRIELANAQRQLEVMEMERSLLGDDRIESALAHAVITRAQSRNG